MLLELVLVGLVLALVGVALYQSNHQPPKDAAIELRSPKATASAQAEVAAKAIEKSVTDDTALSAAAASTADQLNEVDGDLTDLGGSFDESNF